eukprot:5800981-Amphidinium_carterae.1
MHARVVAARQRAAYFAKRRPAWKKTKRNDFSEGDRRNQFHAPRRLGMLWAVIFWVVTATTGILCDYTQEAVHQPVQTTRILCDYTQDTVHQPVQTTTGQLRQTPQDGLVLEKFLQLLGEDFNMQCAQLRLQMHLRAHTIAKGSEISLDRAIRMTDATDRFQVLSIGWNNVEISNELSSCPLHRQGFCDASKMAHLQVMSRQVKKACLALAKAAIFYVHVQSLTDPSSRRDHWGLHIETTRKLAAHHKLRDVLNDTAGALQQLIESGYDELAIALVCRSGTHRSAMMA